jgi:hypothetical protein
MWSTGFSSSKKLSIWMLSSSHQSITHSLIELHTTTMATNNTIPTSSSTYINEPWVHVASQRKDQSNYDYVPQSISKFYTQLIDLLVTKSLYIVKKSHRLCTIDLAYYKYMQQTNQFHQLHHSFFYLFKWHYIKGFLI